MSLSPLGYVRLRQVAIKDDETEGDWFERLRGRYRSLSFGEPLRSSELSAIEQSLEITIPQHLIDFWSGAPGIHQSYNQVICDPREIPRFNERYPKYLPTILESRLFFAGMDGYNFAVSLDDHEDETVYYWCHESGWTGETFESPQKFLEERLAWILAWK